MHCVLSAMRGGGLTQAGNTCKPYVQAFYGAPIQAHSTLDHNNNTNLTLFIKIHRWLVVRLGAQCSSPAIPSRIQCAASASAHAMRNTRTAVREKIDDDIYW